MGLILGIYREVDKANFDAAIGTIMADIGFNAAEGGRAADEGSS